MDSKATSPIYFTTVKYGKPVSLKGEFDPTQPVILVSGLANPIPFDEYGKKEFDVRGHLKFNDHHRYKQKDIQMVNELAFASQSQILMTEKDSVKWAGFIDTLSEQVTAFYLPITIEFLKKAEEEKFQDALIQEIERDLL